MAKLTGNNQHNVTWFYAQRCWEALRNNEPIPGIPYYDTWETEETGGRGRVFTGKQLIEPCKITYGDVVFFGD